MGGVVREVEADARLHGFNAASGLEVGVEDEVIAGIDAPGHAGRFDDGGRIGFPEEEVAVGIEAIAGADFELHAGDAGAPVIRVLAAELGSAVDEDVGVVDDARVAGEDLNSADIAGARDIDRIDEVAEEVLAVGGNVEGLGRGEDEVGRPELPLGVVLGRGRRFGGDAFGHAGVDPALDAGEILIGEAAGIGEFAVAGLGQPGRHKAGLRDGEDLGGPAARVVVGKQAERARAAGMMAGDAVFVEDGRDLFRPGGSGSFLRRLCLSVCACCGYEYEQEGHSCRSQGRECHARGMMAQPTGGAAGGAGWRPASAALSASARSWRLAAGRWVPKVR